MERFRQNSATKKQPKPFWTAKVIFIAVLIAAFYSAPSTVLPGMAQQSGAASPDPLIVETNLKVARKGHTATQLNDGRVLIAGGENDTGAVSDTEFLDPAGASSSSGPGMGAMRARHTAVLLSDGRVLIAGGQAGGQPLASTELFDPSSNSIQSGPPMVRARAGHAAVVLPDGRYLLVGGDDLGTAEIYDPATQHFSLLGNRLRAPRFLHSLAMLNNGKVLIAGGLDASGQALTTAELFDPATMTFSPVPSQMHSPRTNPTLRVLPDGKVQVIGGDDESTMEMYNADGQYFIAYTHLVNGMGSLGKLLRSPGRKALLNLDPQRSGLQAAASGLSSDATAALMGIAERTGYSLTGLDQSNKVVLAGGGTNSAVATNTAFLINDSSNATITVDETDYHPGETVIITGSGFQPGETVDFLMQVEPLTSPDTALTPSVADANGNFINTTFVVRESDANVTLTLTATGESSALVAQTIFTDVGVTSLTINKILLPNTDTGTFNLQINGSTAGTGTNVGNNGTTGAVSLTAGSYTVGEIGANGTSLSNYGIAIICRNGAGITLASGGNNLNVTVPNLVSVVCTITNTLTATPTKLTVNNVTVPNADTGKFNLLIDGVAKASDQGNGGTTGAVTTSVGSHTVGVSAGTGTTLADYITTYNGNCAADGTISLVAGDNKTCTITNTRKPKLTVNKILVPSTDNGTFNLLIDGSSKATAVGDGGTTGAVVLSIGAHTFGESAGAGVNLGDYIQAFSGDCDSSGNITLSAGDNKTCTITNTRKPKLTINKVLVPSTDTGTFNLLIDGSSKATAVGDGGTTGAVVLSIGAHTFGESAGTGVNLEDYIRTFSGDCDSSGNIPLAAGDNKTCTITNTKKPKLTVTKVVVNTGGGTKTASDFTLKVDATTVISGSPLTTTTGSHTVSEVADPDYTSEITGACVPNGWIMLAPGDDKSCTITNSFKAPKLTVTKVVVNTGGGTKAVSDFTLKVDTTAVTSGSPLTTTTGPHTVSEVADSNYTSVISGDCANNGNITLVAGDDKTCTITNSFKAPKLTVTKVVVNTGGGMKAVSDFTLKVDATPVTSGSPLTTTIGQHIVSEVPDFDYTSAIAGACAPDGSIMLAAGDDKICTITNTFKAPKLTVTKVVVNIGGGTKAVSDFTLNVDATPVTSGSPLTTTIGQHTVSEVPDSDYTSAIAGACAPDGSITLAAGDDKACTITNTFKVRSLQLTKTAAPTSYSSLGQTITYTYLVKNTGNVTLAGPLSVADDHINNAVACGSSALAPNATATCTATYAITQADLNAGSVTNNASASGNGVTSPTVSATVTAVQNRTLVLTKTALPASYSSVGQTITYAYVVKNTGNVTLAGPFSVADDHISTAVACGSSALAPNATATCTATYAITQADLNAGSVTNNASASGNGVTSPTVSATVTAVQNRTLVLTKTALPASYSSVGQTITYAYFVKNTGNVTLAGPFSVADDHISTAVACGSSALAPNATATCTATYAITQADLNAGSVTNNASASGNGVTSPTVSATVTAVQNRTLVLTKTALPASYSSVGQTITYAYVVKNTGNVTLAGPFFVVDDHLSTSVACGNSALAPDATSNCTAIYAITQADLDTGSVTNKATASGNGITSPQVSATVTAVQTKALAMTKTAAPSSYSAVGQIITYTYVVKNTGNVTLAGPFSVADDHISTSVACGSSALAPNATTTCTATYAITQADLNAGSVTNHATATNGSVTSNQAQATATANLNSSLNITKSASPTTYNTVGQSITYTYTVTNSGSTTLSGPFMISDDKLGSIQCGTANSLAPNASVNCTASYVIQVGNTGNVLSLPTGVKATIYTGNWLQGLISTQDTTVSGVGPTVPDGIYAGWCIQDHVAVDLHNQTGTLYSTIGGSLPADVAGLPWNKINYVLNHKIRGTGKNDLAFFKDVQTAIWLLLGETNPDFGISTDAQQMVANANANASFVPGAGDVVAVIIYSDGMGTDPNSIQESILEMKLYQSITNTATATGKFGSTTVTSSRVSATVTQVTQALVTPPIDALATGDQTAASTGVTSGKLSTTSANELLLAFVSADNASGANTTVTGVTGAGLIWQLVARANVQRGTAEIWRAFASTQLSNVTVSATLSQAVYSSITVAAFTGVDTSGTNGSGAIGAIAIGNGSSGAPGVTLTTTRNNSWVFGVGNDFDNPIARTLGANQSMVHQYMPPVGDTYWVQRINSAVPAAGTAVMLNDVAPTADRWNLAAVEILPPGPPPQYVTVPNVVNMTQAAATTAITGIHLTLGTVTQASSATVPAGNVISQNPSAGSSVQVGIAVTLVVSSGPAIAAPVVDKMIYSEGSGKRTTASFSTGSSGEALIAFAASDGPASGGQTLTISGAGLTWTLVKRVNTQAGTSEIWKAYAASKLTSVTVSSTQSKTTYNQSLTVIAFTGASGVGASAAAAASSGAPNASLVTTKAGSMVYGIGNDWDGATARVVGANQSLVHQWLDTSTGDTYWVQSLNNSVPVAGSNITLNDTSPTSDRWNFAVVEIIP